MTPWSRRARWVVWGIPALGIAIGVAIPLMRHVERERAEGLAADFLHSLHAAQQEFRTGPAGGYAASFESLTTACPGQGPALTPHALDQLARVGYAPLLRPAGAAQAGRPDCHGRPTVTDYYAAAAPMSTAAAGRQAFAMLAAGRIFVFFDGVAPLEPDMTGEGLAVPLDSLRTFTIP